ncbi:MAG: tRNA-intron lyase [Nitrososphaerota archaeon]|nr:tRNA-intron lyase [Candidatus Termitimicrobium sp.]MCL2432001.1 tRNA-intron lyase [Candidatus Termitimicrobium sp.]MDR0492916.1 tRNA-intron lyase [Nitrososphaerota archaeon]
MKVELIENFLIVWDPAEGTQLYKTAYYGKPVGIPKPKVPEFDVPLVLDLMEGLYLAETQKIEIFENSNEVKVSLKKLRQKAKQLYDEFEEKYAVYRDMRDSGLIVTPGIKFGCDFAVYKQGPGMEHAPYMVTVKKTGSDISATEIVKNGRLATAVRKRFIIAVPDLASKQIKYLMFKWFKA